MTAIAPATSSHRKYRLPCFEILPSRSLPPVECCLGTNPIQAARLRPEQNAFQSPTSAINAVATIGPMPGISSSRRLSSHDRCQAWMCFSIAPISLVITAYWRAKTSRLKNPIVFLVGDDREQFGRTVATFCRDDAELGQMPADRVRQHRSLTNEKLPAAMQHQARLLLFGLRRHKSHRRPSDRLADGARIVGIVFAALEIDLHIARRHQPHRVTERLKLAAPMVSSRTSLNANKARRQRCEKLQYFRSAEPLPDHHRAINIHSINLKNRLRDIETDRDNLAHGRLPSKWFVSTQPPYGTSMPQSGRRPQHHSLHIHKPGASAQCQLHPKCDRIGASQRNAAYV